MNAKSDNATYREHNRQEHACTCKLCVALRAQWEREERKYVDNVVDV